jgi:hypothetical protein
MCPLRFQLVRSERRYARVLRLTSSVDFPVRAGERPGCQDAPVPGFGESRHPVFPEGDPLAFHVADLNAAREPVDVPHPEEPLEFG